MREAEASLQRLWRQADAAQVDPALLDATLRWNVVAARLDDVSTGAAQPSALLGEEARPGCAFLAGLVLPTSRPAPNQPASRGRASVVLIRRRSAIVAFSVEYARKISRGRAPPAI
jgi:hypothetical protein